MDGIQKLKKSRRGAPIDQQKLRFYTINQGKGGGRKGGGQSLNCELEPQTYDAIHYSSFDPITL